jgi:hypothetical protein
VRRWLEREQTLNERLGSDGTSIRIDMRNASVAPSYRPERRPVRPQEVVWLPDAAVRTYGPLRAEVRKAFGYRLPPGRAPLFLHPQPPRSHRRARARHGSDLLTDVRATPTASYRTVLAWRERRAPVLLKLSLGAKVSGVRRALSEYYLVTGIVVSRLLDTIPRAERRRLGFDWFAEPAGLVETERGTGWILRRLPRLLTRPGARELVPVFSLIAPRGAHAPMLVDLIRQSGLRPERFVVERLLRPYVRMLAHLLFEEGIQVQGHPQNVLVEVDGDSGGVRSSGRELRLTGRIVLRDLTDTSVNLALRVAKRRPLPLFGKRWLPRGTPFPILRSATDCRGYRGRGWPLPARDTVERYGLGAFVWSVNTVLQRFFRRYDARAVARRYLELWQAEARAALAVDPEISLRPLGLATDEAIAHFVSHVDWQRLGGGGGASLPADVEPLPIAGWTRRRSGPVYRRVECAWGDLYVDRGCPTFLRPAF